jgi:surface protein
MSVKKIDLNTGNIIFFASEPTAGINYDLEGNSYKFVSNGTNLVDVSLGTVVVDNSVQPLASFRIQTLTTPDTLVIDKTNSVGLQVDWGDGSDVETVADGSADMTHEYATVGTYTVNIVGGTTDRIAFSNASGYYLLTGVMTPISTNLGINSAASMFYHCEKITYWADGFFDAISPNITNMDFCFYGGSAGGFALPNEYFPDLSNCDFSNVLTARYAFAEQKYFNKNIPSDWSSCADMEYFFSGCEVWNGGTDSTVTFDVSSATDIRGLFHECYALAKPVSLTLNPAGSINATQLFSGCHSFNHTITMDESKINDFNQMFQNTWVFNQDISGWDVSNAIDFGYMFNNALVFNQNLGSWVVDNVLDFSGMFYNAEAFNNNGSDSIKNWNVSNGTRFNIMFRDTLVFNQPIESWDVSSGEYFSNMFQNADGFNQSLSGWTLTSCLAGGLEFMFTSNGTFNGPLFSLPSAVTSLRDMFNGATAFNHPSITSWDVSNITSFYQTFSNATAFNQDITGWTFRTSGTKINMRGMFQWADSFTQNISGWDTSWVENMQGMFLGNDNFNSDISGWDTGNVTTTYQMFYGTGAFDQDVSGWDLSSVTTMHEMFRDAIAFNNGGASMSSFGPFNASLTSMYRLFYGATAFNQPVSWGDAVSGITNMIDMFRDATLFDQDISAWNITGLTLASNMLNGSAFSQTNYDLLLSQSAGWPSQSYNNDVAFHAGPATYDDESSDIADGRADLVTAGWSITDGGPD